MPITIGGFEYERLEDIEQWPSFVEWWNGEYTEPASIDNRECREMLEAYIAGAYWEFKRRVALAVSD